MTVAVVTDSSAYLPTGRLAGEPVTVVPLSVLVDHDCYVEGVDRAGTELSRVLARAGGATTSRPSPRAFLARYERLAEAGATSVVSVHVAAALSGTCDSAVLAARESPIPVRVVDSGTIAMALGYAVLDAAAVARAGGSVDEAAAAARATAARAQALFCVGSLEFLRRGGRIGAASAFLGSALAIKPILELDRGRILPVEKQRTQARALVRLAELTQERLPVAAGVRLTVHHAGAPDAAARLQESLTSTYAEALADPIDVIELGLVAATHVGPGSVAVVGAPGDADPPSTPGV